MILVTNSWVIARCTMLPPRQGEQLTFYVGCVRSLCVCLCLDRKVPRVPSSNFLFSFARIPPCRVYDETQPGNRQLILLYLVENFRTTKLSLCEASHRLICLTISVSRTQLERKINFTVDRRNGDGVWSNRWTIVSGTISAEDSLANKKKSFINVGNLARKSVCG